MSVSPDIIDRLWERTEPFVFITRAQFDQTLVGWDIESHEIDGGLHYVTLVKGPEFHFDILSEKRPFTMHRVRACLKPILKRYGYVTTRTPKRESRQQRFNKIVGFKRTGEDEFFVHYRMNAEDVRWSR